GLEQLVGPAQQASGAVAALRPVRDAVLRHLPDQQPRLPRRQPWLVGGIPGPLASVSAAAAVETPAGASRVTRSPRQWSAGRVVLLGQQAVLRAQVLRQD